MIESHEADELALRARTGDAEALARLYDEFAPSLLAYVERLAGDRATAEDVIHETFLQLVAKRGRFQARGRFRQWLFTVAANTVRSQQRRGRFFLPIGRIRGVEFDADRTPSHTAMPDNNLADQESLDMIERSLAQLPSGYAAAFHLRVREGFNYREIAEITGEPEGTLRSRVHHTLSRLRQDLTDAGMGPGTKAEGKQP